jgi:hypothetical protein
VFFWHTHTANVWQDAVRQAGAGVINGWRGDKTITELLTQINV